MAVKMAPTAYNYHNLNSRARMTTYMVSVCRFIGSKTGIKIKPVNTFYYPKESKCPHNDRHQINVLLCRHVELI